MKLELAMVLGIIYTAIMVPAVTYLLYKGKLRKELGWVVLVISALLGFAYFAPMFPWQLQLLMLGKRQVCESLSVQGFARSHGLTPAETRVLVPLCQGVPPGEVAEMLGVGIATVRSQIGSIRQKTGAESIRALVGQVAMLPPLMGVLRGGMPHDAARLAARRPGEAEILVA